MHYSANFIRKKREWKHFKGKMRINDCARKFKIKGEGSIREVLETFDVSFAWSINVKTKTLLPGSKRTWPHLRFSFFTFSAEISTSAMAAIAFLRVCSGLRDDLFARRMTTSQSSLSLSIFLFCRRFFAADSPSSLVRLYFSLPVSARHWSETEAPSQDHAPIIKPFANAPRHFQCAP